MSDIAASELKNSGLMAYTRRVASRHRVFFLFFTVYAAAFLYTVPDYGLTWDTYAEYPRAAAYIEWHISGRAGPSEVPAEEQLPWGNLTYELAKANNMESANGCLPSLWAALLGKVLYQKLHWLDPIDAYHFGLAMLWLLAISLYYFYAARLTGRATALLAVVFLALSPRIFEEAHNNMKDLPSSIFGGIAVLAWLSGFITRRPGRILLSGVWLGISLASKHTSLMLLAPMACAAAFVWISERSWPSRAECWAIPGSLVISAVILFGHLPHLWVPPSEAVRRVGDILAIGAARNIENPQVNGGALWLAGVTTPPVVLIGALLGALAASYCFKRCATKLSALYFVLIISLVAVFVAWSSGWFRIYDGIRNFQHYWPALALLSALGWIQVIQWTSRIVKLPRRVGLSIGTIIVTVPVMAADIEYHPHQITYFNAFVGGLNGAHNSTEQYRKTLPGFEALDYWGSSIRNCVEWANAELPNGARLTFGVGDHIGKFYSIRKGLRCDCFDGERVSCGDSYVISLERLVFFKPCDYWVRMSGTAVFEVRIDGVRLAAVFKVPGRFNLCHKAPSLERVDPLRLSDGIHDVTLRVRSELCARDEPISLFVRRSGEHDWISWNDFLVKNPGAQEAIAAQGAVPATLEPGCDMRFTLPSAALRHLIPGKAPVLTFVVAVGRAENILLSNTVDVEFE